MELIKRKGELKDILKCPYCKNSDYENYERLKGKLTHQWLSCKKCGRNFQAKIVIKYDIINADL